ncbi:hypothetical protein LEP1GSC170_5035 [Leptospira interrogans serovar Bataviae str. HAI135]|nr:hypothetical protein LEP1GSC170_5035 [Leptospira interrogans serovar Bataviae str. HAI135]
MPTLLKDTLKNNYKFIFYNMNSLLFPEYKTYYKNKLDAKKSFRLQNVFFIFLFF